MRLLLLVLIVLTSASYGDQVLEFPFSELGAEWT